MRITVPQCITCDTLQNVDEKELAAYQAQILADLQAEMAAFQPPDPLRPIKRDFLFGLDDFRLRRHLTHDVWAEKAGVHRANLTRAVSMRGNPSLETLLRLVTALDAKLLLQSVKISKNKQGNTWKEL